MNQTQKSVIANIKEGLSLKSDFNFIKAFLLIPLLIYDVLTLFYLEASVSVMDRIIKKD